MALFFYPAHLELHSHSQYWLLQSILVWGCDGPFLGVRWLGICDCIQRHDLHVLGARCQSWESQAKARGTQTVCTGRSMGPLTPSSGHTGSGQILQVSKCSESFHTVTFLYPQHSSSHIEVVRDRWWHQEAIDTAGTDCHHHNKPGVGMFCKNQWHGQRPLNMHDKCSDQELSSLHIIN